MRSDTDAPRIFGYALEVRPVPVHGSSVRRLRHERCQVLTCWRVDGIVQAMLGERGFEALNFLFCACDHGLCGLRFGCLTLLRGYHVVHDASGKRGGIASDHPPSPGLDSVVTAIAVPFILSRNVTTFVVKKQTVRATDLIGARLLRRRKGAQGFSAVSPLLH